MIRAEPNEQSSARHKGRYQPIDNHGGNYLFDKYGSHHLLINTEVTIETTQTEDPDSSPSASRRWPRVFFAHRASFPLFGTPVNTLVSPKWG